MTAVTKRTVAVLGLVALIVAFLVPAFQSPTAVAASPYYVGQGYEYSDASGGHWFGAQKGPYPDDGLSWCVFLGPNALIPSDANSVTINTLANTDGLVKTGRDEYEFTNVAQAAWMLAKYEGVDTPDSRAAISIVLHANFERQVTYKGLDAKARLDSMFKWVNDHPAVAELAKRYVAEAKASGVTGYSSPSHTVDSQREGDIHDIAVKNPAGNNIAGVPFTLTLSGPAVFVSNNSQTISGTTTAEPLTFKWRATGNGEVSYSLTYTQKTRRTVTFYDPSSGKQTMLTYGKRSATSDPTEVSVPGGSWNVVYDFQPKGVSQVKSASVPDSEGVLTDTLTASADGSYTNPSWLDGVKVKYEAEVYYLGDTLPTQAATVPAGVQPVATASLTFDKPGSQDATVKVTKPGFYTWVWKVVKSNQEAPDRIHADWSDGYALETETSVRQRAVKITSENNVIRVHSGSDAKTFINDTVHVSGFPDNHGDFKGYGGIEADKDTIDQSLYCIPKATKITKGVTLDMTPVKTWSIPAKNGDYRVGDYFPAEPGEHVQDIDCRGTLVFVSSFAGDGRVASLRTSELDPNESFVPELPEIHTTATDKADGDKFLAPTGTVTIQDVVTYTELAAGKEYTLIATLMDKSTGEPFMDCGSTTVSDYSTQIGKLVEELSAKTKNSKLVLVSDVKALVIKYLPDAASRLGEGQGLASLLGVKLSGNNKLDFTGADLSKVGKKLNTLVSALDSSFDRAATTATTATTTTTTTATTAAAGTGQNCKPITVTKTIVPTHHDGTVTVDIPVKASLLVGKQTVVFEDVLREGREPVVHHEINDEGQTVYSPKIRTTATGVDGKKEVVEGKVTLVDDISYQALRPGETFTVTGEVVDKKTGKRVDCLDSDPVTFKADKSGDGKVTAKFTGTCEVNEDTDWVIYETVYLGKNAKGKKIVEHRDINDVSQTVTIKPAPPLAKTGTPAQLALVGAALGVLIGGFVLVARRKMRKD